MTTIVKHLKNKAGFMVSDVVIAVVIIGSLTAIAIPNFLRIKMNANMELVKQHLQVIAKDLTDLYNKSNPNDYPEDILTLDGDQEEELSITASLNSIRNLGYLVITWKKDEGLTVCPGDGLWGIAGDRCFRLNLSPFGISIVPPDVEIEPYDMGPTSSVGFFELLLRDSSLTDDEKVKLLTGFFEILAYGVNFYFDDRSRYDPALEKMTPVTAVEMKPDLKAEFDRLFGRVQGNLKTKGIEVNVIDFIDAGIADFYNSMPHGDPGGPLGNAITSFKFTDPKFTDPNGIAYPYDSEEAQAMRIYCLSGPSCVPSLGNFS